MFKRKQTRAIQKFIYSVFKQFWQLTRTASRKLSRWLVRNLLHKGYGKRRYATSKAGFVLPTVAVLLLVVALVVAAILFRTGSRTNQVMGEREQQVIYNAATPAIERAKSKLEYLFLKDTRLPNGPPSDEYLMGLLTNNLNSNYPVNTLQGGVDPYLYPDEDDIQGVNGRLDLDGDGQPDPAWAYPTDVDGDGTKEIVVYGIFLKTVNQNNNPTVTFDGSTDADKAKKLVVRNGPMNTINISNQVCRNIIANAQNNNPSGAVTSTDPNDWTEAGSAVLRKTFQVDAIVISNKQGLSRTVATLEFQQDRQLDKGNKWGAWFRYDLEIFPGSSFNWNGAMYSGGNIFVGSTNFKSYLISSQNSCFYTKDASEITVANLIANSSLQQTTNYQGQIGTGRLSNDSYDNNSAIFHVVNPDNSPNYTTGVTMDKDKDSIQDQKTPSKVSLDPVILFTQDVSKARSGSPPPGTDATNELARDTRWNTTNAAAGNIGYFQTRKRIYNKTEATPYVDDTYRADNRYGPKPKYDKIQIPKNGDDIPSSETTLINNTVAATDQEFKGLGLDGYWERRARAEGLRIIVGERLQLGNTYGWTDSDPMYPPNQNPIKHEEQQRRTLRDNLAAVQSAAVYHYTAGNSGYFPVAFVATTSHPGTGNNTTTNTTIYNSKNFNLNSTFYSYPSGTPDATLYPGGILYSDFFKGRGTNGWEYEVVAGSGENESTFKTQISSTQPLGKALRNLGDFAGEKDGAFPPTKQDRVYPHPYLTIWGNFSNLNRALDNLDSVGYDNLSIADKSYIHTAAGTLGMLANNVYYFEGYTYNAVDLDGLNTALKNAFDNANSSPGSTPDAYINGITDPNPNQAILLKKIAQFVYQKEQIARDRLLGFASPPSATSPTTPVPSGAIFKYDVDKHDADTSTTTPDFKYVGVTYDKNATSGTTKTIYVGCDISAGSGNNWFGMGNPSTWGTGTTATANEEKFIRLAVSLCPTQPKYPSLYYIFPISNFTRPQISGSTNPPYTYLNPPSSLGTIPSANFTSISDAEIKSMALRPKAADFSTGCTDTAWCLPTTGTASGSGPGKDDFLVTSPNGTQKRVSIIDNALFNGQEMMNVRVLDVDLNQLRSVTFNGDSWLPANHGVVYAFREDAVREDGISRPSNGTYTSIGPDDTSHPKTNATNPTAPTDPKLTNLGISPKPVDFYPDPDRRPYGFRLRNGQVIKRATGDQGYGISFISDNPVYIQGNFNFHSEDGTSAKLLEEFTTALASDWGNFYTRTTLDTKFARPNTDTWRPSEIASDAVTILSDNFDAGSVEDGIKNDTSKKNSYRGFNGPVGNNVNPERGWIREDGTVSNTSLPIKISRNGYPLYCPNSAPAPTTGQPCSTQQEYKGSYRPFGTSYGTSGVLNDASNTWVNATIVSGILPSQKGQSYGGMHNFPRLIENWGGGAKDLNISGSFVQLSFSTYATGLYDQDAWEPTQNPDPSKEYNFYYDRPNRRWGYDVGLQYAPAGPIAQRFLQSASPRSEFYRDLEVTDPYICRLRRALNQRRSDLDPASTTECPS